MTGMFGYGVCITTLRGDCGASTYTELPLTSDSTYSTSRAADESGGHSSAKVSSSVGVSTYPNRWWLISGAVLQLAQSYPERPPGHSAGGAFELDSASRKPYPSHVSDACHVLEASHVLLGATESVDCGGARLVRPPRWELDSPRSY